QHQLSREVASLREQLQSQSKYKMLFGQSERMAEVQDLIERVADTDVTVLIRGESGTGKELVARALYASSLRRDKPFVKVNCAAPNKDLELAVAEGQFREDLFFRLNVVSINMPPLRERREEIPPLCDYFLKKYSVQYNKPYPELSQDTMRLFMDYDWPGNIRELENLIKRTVVLGTESPIQKEISHGISMATHRLQHPSVVPHPSAAPH